MLIGPKYDINVLTLHLSGMPPLLAKQVKYLGIYVLDGKYFKVDITR